MESLIVTFTAKYKDTVKHKKLDYAEFKAIQCSLLVNKEVIVANSLDGNYDFIKSNTYIIKTKGFSQDTLVAHLRHFTENCDVSGFANFINLLGVEG